VSPITNNFRSGPSYGITIEGLPETSAMLRDAAARGEDMRPAMARIKVLFTEGHKANFDSKGAFLGHPWPDNSDETKARKAREGIPALSDVLVGSGDLQEALAGGKGARTRVSKGSVSVGVSPFYAIFAQGGAKGARRGVEPKRPVLGITDAERDASLGILTDFLIGR
jgi:hypothetical protein